MRACWRAAAARPDRESGALAFLRTVIITPDELRGGTVLRSIEIFRDKGLVFTVPRRGT